MQSSLATIAHASRRRAACLAVVTALWVSTPADAHDGLREQIQVLSIELAGEPARADLLVRRADLYRLSGDFPRAAADLGRAATLAPTLPAVHLSLAHLRLAEGRPRDAVAAATAFLASDPQHVEAHVVRARAWAALEHRGQAAADLSVALTYRPTPDLYIERARLQAGGRAQFETALQGLEQGLARLGSVVTLELEALALERRLGRWDAALRRIDAQTARVARKESWLARRGDVLREAGRHPEAIEAYRAALAAAAALPARTRTTAATLALIGEVEAALETVSPSPRPVRRSTAP